MNTILRNVAMVCVFIGLSGCVSTKKYYPPTPETRVEIKNKKGDVIEVRGALQEEEDGFDLGTKGLGTYEFIHVEGIGL